MEKLSLESDLVIPRIGAVVISMDCLRPPVWLPAVRMIESASMTKLRCAAAQTETDLAVRIEREDLDGDGRSIPLTDDGSVPQG